jgi:anti-anti-sigma factor
MAVESHLRVGRSDDGFLVQVIGHGTMCESHAFREFIDQCFSQGNRSVTVDMSRCDYLDSTFLGSLIGLQKRCERDRSRFLIAADQAARVRLFTTSVLDRYLQFTEECPRSVSEMIELETPQLDPHEMGKHVMQSHRQLAGLDCQDADKFRSIADRLESELGDATVRWEE